MARCPWARLPSEESTVTSRPVWRTAWRDAVKRRVSPIMAQIAVLVIGPTPYWTCNAVQPG